MLHFLLLESHKTGGSVTGLQNLPQHVHLENNGQTGDLCTPDGNTVTMQKD